MKHIESIINFFKKILSYISSDPTEIEVFLTLIGTIFSFLIIVGGIICFFDGKMVAHSNKPQNQAKRTLKGYNRHISVALRNESVFFCEDDPKKRLFYKGVPINKFHSGKKSYLAKLKLSSYILLGEAGSGKSSIIKDDYLFHCNRFIDFWRIRTGIVYINQQFLSRKIEGIGSLEELIDCIQRTKYKKIHLYIDGIDEFGETKLDEIFKNFITISNQIKKVKITSRTNFAVQNIINHNNERPFWFKENQRYLVGRWQKEHLTELTAFLLKHLRIQTSKRNDITNAIDSDGEKWHKYIDSPLLMKLYLYILIYGDQNRKIAFDNKYLFYTQFVSEIISTHRKRQSNFNVAQIQQQLDNLSDIVFSAFSSNCKQIQYSQDIAAILKPANDGVSHFVHETFFEYFVARHYLLQLTKKYPDHEAVTVLHQTYTNDFADFITFALNSTDDNTRKQIVETLFTIYHFTFGEDASNKSLTQFSSIRVRIGSSTRIRQAVHQLTERDFFTLKYEIIFRLGRIDHCLNEMINFLNFVYNHDANINVKENPEYYIAVLKRCCAISCSFLGSEQIELDYVNKMIPCNQLGKNPNYILNYDLANRSHTLLFYGDVIKTNIFDFKDDATNNPFALAFSKRIERLQFELPEDIAQMNKKQKKKYYFRVFDLATIYTFMFNRQKALSDEELKIVSSTKVHFIGASDERNSLMHELLDLILNLNRDLTASSSVNL